MTDKLTPDALLASLIEKRELPNFTDERGIHYILERKESRKWEVRKLEDINCTTYYLGKIKERWYCSCPAGTRGRNCKHAMWVSVLSKTTR